MLACVQCGLSISETATFCQVCGARVEAQAVATAVAEPEPVVAAESDAAPEPVVEPAPEPDVEPEAVVELEPQAAAGPDPESVGEPKPEQDESAEVILERRMAEVSSLLEDAAAREDGDPAAAAVLLREAILACLDAADDPLGSERVSRDLLCGFDRLSALLQREELAEEALEVVDDAALLGLLTGSDQSAAWHRDALKDRREDLRRTLFVDSAQL